MYYWIFTFSIPFILGIIVLYLLFRNDKDAKTEIWFICLILCFLFGLFSVGCFGQAFELSDYFGDYKTYELTEFKIEIDLSNIHDAEYFDLEYSYDFSLTSHQREGTILKSAIPENNIYVLEFEDMRDGTLSVIVRLYKEVVEDNIVDKTALIVVEEFRYTYEIEPIMKVIE